MILNKPKKPNWRTSIPAQGKGWHPSLMAAAAAAKGEGLSREEFVAEVRKHTPGGVAAGRVKEIGQAYDACKSNTSNKRGKMAAGRRPAYRVTCKPCALPPAMNSGWYYFLITNYEEGEHIVMAPGRFDREKRRDTPLDFDPHRETHTREEWLDLFEECGGPSQYWPPTEFDGGVYVCVNPMSQGRKADHASAYRNVLLEMDSGTIEQQYGVFMQSGIPFVTLTTSAGKSIHAIVRVNALDHQDFKGSVDALYQALGPWASGLDPANKDASRYTRLPGAVRHGKIQELVGCRPVTPSTIDVNVWVDKAIDTALLAELPAAVDAANYVSEVPPEPDPVLKGAFDSGDKVMIVGGSKAKKTFFSLQLALALAAGFAMFLAWAIPRRRRVLIVQFEITELNYRRRVHQMCRTMGVCAEQVGGYLSVVSLRGHTVNEDHLLALGRHHAAEVIVVDPLYKLVDGDENKAEDLKPILRTFDRLAEETGATVLYLHHNPKGTAGDRETIDRGAGSGILARDFDAAIYLNNHRQEGLLAVETVLRNYPPSKPFSLAWAEGHFVVDAAAAEVKTSNDRRSKSGSRLPIATQVQRAVELVGDSLMTVNGFLSKIRVMMVVSEHFSRTIRDEAINSGRLKRTGKLGFGGADLIGPPGLVDAHIAEHRAKKAKAAVDEPDQ